MPQRKTSVEESSFIDITRYMTLTPDFIETLSLEVSKIALHNATTVPQCN